MDKARLPLSKKIVRLEEIVSTLIEVCKLTKLRGMWEHK